MHELSLALSILDLAAEEVERHGGGHVAAIHVRLGPLAGVVPDALRGAFELARESSALPTTDLVIEEVALAAYCPTCRTECAPASVMELWCPSCSTPTPEILRGRELEVIALEIEA